MAEPSRDSPLSRRDFLKLASLAPASLAPDWLVFPPGLHDLEARLSAAKQNIDLFMAGSHGKVPETATPIHPDVKKDEDIRAAFYPPLLDRRVINQAANALAVRKIKLDDPAALEEAAYTAGGGVLWKLVKTDSYLDLISAIQNYFSLLNAISRWQSRNPEPLRSPEPDEFSDQELNSLIQLLTSMFPVPARVREKSQQGEENVWGEAGQNTIYIVTEKLLRLDEKARTKMAAFIFGHELSHLLDIWMAFRPGSLFRYLPKDGRLFELFSLRSRADGIQTLAVDGHTQLRLFPGGFGVREHPWEFLDPNSTSQKVWQSLLIYPTAALEAETIGFRESELMKFFVPDENRLDHYLFGVILQQYRGGLTLEQIQNTDWSAIAGLELAGRALDRIRGFNLDVNLLSALFGETSPVPPEKLAEALAPTAGQLLTTGEYTGPIPPAVLKRFYWGSIPGSRELLAQVGSVWFYWRAGLADETETQLLTDLFASNPQAQYLRKVVEVLDKGDLGKLIKTTQAWLEKVFPVLASSTHDIRLKLL